MRYVKIFCNYSSKQLTTSMRAWLQGLQLYTTLKFVVQTPSCTYTQVSKPLYSCTHRYPNHSIVVHTGSQTTLQLYAQVAKPFKVVHTGIQTLHSCTHRYPNPSQLYTQVSKPFPVVRTGIQTLHSCTHRQPNPSQLYTQVAKPFTVVRTGSQTLHSCTHRYPNPSQLYTQVSKPFTVVRTGSQTLHSCTHRYPNPSQLYTQVSKPFKVVHTGIQTSPLRCAHRYPNHAQLRTQVSKPLYSCTHRCRSHCIVIHTGVQTTPQLYTLAQNKTLHICPSLFHRDSLEKESWLKTNTEKPENNENPESCLQYSVKRFSIIPAACTDHCGAWG